MAESFTSSSRAVAFAGAGILALNLVAAPPHVDRPVTPVTHVWTGQLAAFEMPLVAPSTPLAQLVTTEAAAASVAGDVLSRVVLFVGQLILAPGILALQAIYFVASVIQRIFHRGTPAAAFQKRAAASKPRTLRTAKTSVPKLHQPAAKSKRFSVGRSGTSR